MCFHIKHFSIINVDVEVIKNITVPISKAFIPLSLMLLKSTESPMATIAINMKMELSLVNIFNISPGMMPVELITPAIMK